MSVLDVLIEEHLLLYRLVGYLQNGAVESRAPERLREHFAWEERVLWPLRTPSGPLAEVDLENRARAELLLLTAEAAQQGIRLSASVGPS